MATAAARFRGKPARIGLARRAMVGWRALLALVGGYAVGALLSMVLALALPRLGVSRLEASIWGTLAGLLAMPLVPIAAFGIRRTRVASAWIVGGALVLWGVILGLGAL